MSNIISGAPPPENATAAPVARDGGKQIGGWLGSHRNNSTTAGSPAMTFVTVLNDDGHVTGLAPFETLGDAAQRLLARVAAGRRPA